jgi:hypothetical protein
VLISFEDGSVLGEALFGSVGEIALWIDRVAGSRAIQKLVDLGKSDTVGPVGLALLALRPAQCSMSFALIVRKDGTYVRTLMSGARARIVLLIEFCLQLREFFLIGPKRFLKAQRHFRRKRCLAVKKKDWRAPGVRHQAALPHP